MLPHVSKNKELVDIKNTFKLPRISEDLSNLSSPQSKRSISVKQDRRNSSFGPLVDQEVSEIGDQFENLNLSLSLNYHRENDHGYTDIDDVPFNIDISPVKK